MFGMFIAIIISNQPPFSGTPISPAVKKSAGYPESISLLPF
jgi:hypothetical protein